MSPERVCPECGLVLHSRVKLRAHMVNVHGAPTGSPHALQSTPQVREPLQIWASCSAQPIFKCWLTSHDDALLVSVVRVRSRAALWLQMDSGGQPGPLTYSPLTEGIQAAAATSLTGRFDAASVSGAGLPVVGEPLQGVVSPTPMARYRQSPSRHPGVTGLHLHCTVRGGRTYGQHADVCVG